MRRPPERRTSDFSTWPHNARGQHHTSSNFTHKMKGKLTVELFEGAALGSGQLRRQSANPTTLWATKGANQEQGCWKLEECRRSPAESLSPWPPQLKDQKAKETGGEHGSAAYLKQGIKNGVRLCDLQFSTESRFWWFYFQTYRCVLWICSGTIEENELTRQEDRKIENSALLNINWIYSLGFVWKHKTCFYSWCNNDYSFIFKNLNVLNLKSSFTLHRHGIRYFWLKHLISSKLLLQ